jgi:hypothetical protein
MVVTSGGANAHPSGIPDCIQDVSTIPATVLVTVPDQHSQSTACTIITMTESLGMFFTQI